MTKEEKHEALFAGLVMMFHAAAMQQLGKTKNPATDKVERNLEQAQMSIDMLDMLEVRTRNNVSAEEAKLLKNALQDLKLNYVDEVGKDQAAANPS